MKNGFIWLSSRSVCAPRGRLVNGSDTNGDVPIAALNIAIAQRKPPSGMICHTDQGSGYECVDYRKVLSNRGLLPSMSRLGDCHNNAFAESFFSSLKKEITQERLFATRQEAMAAISDGAPRRDV